MYNLIYKSYIMTINNDILSQHCYFNLLTFDSFKFIYFRQVFVDTNNQPIVVLVR